MNILICPDKFKGSLPAYKVCEYLGMGISEVYEKAQLTYHPLADGGDGTISILKNPLNLSSKTVDTIDPLGRPIQSEYYISDKTAFVELASASGLALLDKYERNPLITSTRGTGIMMREAIENGAEKIYLFIGGSATNDAGIGIAHALGFDFLDAQGDQLDPVGHNLSNIHSIDIKNSIELSHVEIKVLCDVTNPMHGPDGAAYTYAPQKGAEQWVVKKLDQGLQSYDSLLKTQFNKDISEMPGIGAAGAVGASLVGLLNAELQRGFEMVSELTRLEEAIKNSDLVITGEGKIDSTSIQGKVVGNVLSLCQHYSKPCAVVSGGLDVNDQFLSKFAFHHSIISLTIDENDAMSHPMKYLVAIGKKIGADLESEN